MIETGYFSVSSRTKPPLLGMLEIGRAFRSPGRTADKAGIVALLAIRRDHRTTDKTVKRGDLFEIILIQVKGGSARNHSQTDLKRLQAAAARYHAKAVVLAT